ncbi:preprotein translocase subunit Sec61beta [Candidatus Woesearchaeota archaeon]|nr:preprotein translocase subunit Sec61beta [Candidatus Woesearchaeota archaeon]
MAEDKIQMPAGMGGLVRYFDDYQSKIEFKPMVLVVVILLVIIIELTLHYKLFG